MADNGSSGIGNMASQVSEAVVKPIQDEVGKALEVGLGQITGNQKTPQDQNAAIQQQQQIKQLEQEDKKETARERKNILQFIDTVIVNQKRFKQEEEQKLNQKKQEEDANKEKEKEIKQFTLEEKTQDLDPSRFKGKAEIKRGVGG